MKKLILIAALAVAGGAVGTTAGILTRPVESAAPPPPEAKEPDAHPAEGEAASTEFVKMTSQFVIPMVGDGHVTSLVVLSVSLEVAAGQTEHVYSVEPKLRDAFLQVLFDHANSGGFDGNFTERLRVDRLRGRLLDAGKEVMADKLIGVLITDIGRQDA